MPATLGYWNIRGLVQPIRLLLHYCGENYDEQLYKTGPPPEYSTDSWFSVKFKQGLDFPNLPYYKDGDIKLTQSNAIIRHLARKYNLYGETEKIRAEADMLCDTVTDFISTFIKMCYQKTALQDKDGYIANDLPPKMDMFVKFLGQKPWFCGHKINFVDFLFYEYLDQHRILLPGSLDSYKTILAFLERFEALPAIKAYMASDDFIADAFYMPKAFIGGK